MVAEKMQGHDKSFEEIKLRYQLIMNKEIIPFSYISEKYFKKSKNWIYQRLNGNKVNGKPAEYTSEDIKTLQSPTGY